jgi:hypothetical protein
LVSYVEPSTAHSALERERVTRKLFVLNC